MKPARCICKHDPVLHALTDAGVRAGRCAERLCVCGSTERPNQLVAVLRKLVVRTAARFRRRPAPVQQRNMPLAVTSAVSDVELLLFRDRPRHGRPALNRAPAAAYWPVRQRQAAPRH